MKFLLDQFRTRTTALVDLDGNIVIEGSYFDPGDVLGRLDPTAFDAAYEDWKNYTWLPEVLRRAEDVLDRFNNRERFFDLVDAIRKDAVVPFVGSGMSNPTGFPLWGAFLKLLCGLSHLPEEELESILQTGDFEQAASAIQAKMTKRLFDEQIEHTFRIREISQIRGAVRYLPHIFKKDAITLNYDNILELVFQDNEVTFNQVLAGGDIPNFRRLSTNGERCLIKFHGDRARPETRVLTAEEYERVYVKDERVRESLIELFRNSRLLFLGCSLTIDRTMNVFKEIADRDPDTPRHIAFLKYSDDGTRVARENFLTERSIFPIWYECDSDNCHDEKIEALLVKIMNELGLL